VVVTSKPFFPSQVFNINENVISSSIISIENILSILILNAKIRKIVNDSVKRNERSTIKQKEYPGPGTLFVFCRLKK